jgi:iron complex outermembrane receptor protein
MHTIDDPTSAAAPAPARRAVATRPTGTHRHRQGRVIGLALLCALLLARGAAAQQAAADAATPKGGFSFEQLGSMEVSGVSKAVEHLRDSPADVTVVTSDDIRAYGYRTLGDLLGAAPGFFSYSDRNYSYVGARGFAPIDGYNSRVLLLVDGFPTNDNVYQQALLGNEGIIDLSLIDRVEIIAGPSSSVYGTNAFLGVINVILKNPSQLTSSAKFWHGSGDENGVSATYSGATDGDTRYFVQASESGSRGLDVTFAPQPGLPDGARVSGADGTDIARAFAKILNGNLRVNLAFSERRQHSGNGLYGDVLGDTRSFVRDGETFGDLHYEGALGSATDYALRASAAEYRYDTTTVDAYPPGLGLPAVLPGFLPIVGDWVDMEATATHHISASDRLIVGAEVRRDLRQSVQFSNPVQGTFLDIDASQTLAGVYAQSDVDWTEHWSTSLGVRADSTSGLQRRLSPRLALLWKPSAEQVFKLLSGSAFRNPSAYEQNFAQPPLNIRSPVLAPERVHTLDLVYEAQLGATSRLALTAFHYRALDLITQTIAVPATGATDYQNADSAQARGFDVALDQQLTATLKLRLSGEYAHAYDATGEQEQNSPQWNGRLALDQSLPFEWRLGSEVYYEGRRLAIDNSTLPGYTILNSTLTSPAVARQPTFALSLYNLFNRTYGQPVAGWAGTNVNQLGRTWRATVEYAF